MSAPTPLSMQRAGTARPYGRGLRRAMHATTAEGCRCEMPAPTAEGCRREMHATRQRAAGGHCPPLRRRAAGVKCAHLRVKRHYGCKTASCCVNKKTEDPFEPSALVLLFSLLLSLEESGHDPYCDECCDGAESGSYRNESVAFLHVKIVGLDNDPEVGCVGVIEEGRTCCNGKCCDDRSDST